VHWQSSLHQWAFKQKTKNNRSGMNSLIAILLTPPARAFEAWALARAENLAKKEHAYSTYQVLRQTLQNFILFLYSSRRRSCALLRKEQRPAQ